MVRDSSCLLLLRTFCGCFVDCKIVNKDDAISIVIAYKENIQTQPVFFKSNFLFLPNAITCLKKQLMTLASAISIVNDAKIKLTQIGGEQGKMVKTKIEKMLEKNEGYKLII